MWEIVLLSGLVLLIIGLVKRKTGWGKGIALVGLIGIVVSLIVHGPEMLEGFMEGYREARAD